MKTRDIERVGQGMSIRNYVRMMFIVSRFNDMRITVRLMRNNMKLLGRRKLRCLENEKMKTLQSSSYKEK